MGKVIIFYKNKVYNFSILKFFFIVFSNKAINIEMRSERSAAVERAAQHDRY